MFSLRAAERLFLNGDVRIKTQSRAAAAKCLPQFGVRSSSHFDLKVDE